jgi:tubulin beta
VYIQASQCGSQIGTKFWRWCATNGIRGDGEYCGISGEQLGHINVFYNEASVGKYMPRAALFDLEPGVIDAARALPLGELFRPGNLENRYFGEDKNRVKGLASTQSLGENSAESLRCSGLRS